MHIDLTQFLNDWEFGNNHLSARLFVGEDGRKKVQLRIDIGVLHMEYSGRPDGKTFEDYSSILELVKDDIAQSESFELTEDHILELTKEALQIYHRYICLYQLKDYEKVVLDTRHNLDILSILEQYTSAEVYHALFHHKPHILMMHYSARAHVKLDENNKDKALEILQKGINVLRDVLGDEMDFENPELTSEIYALKELQHMITDDSVPDSIAEIDQLEMDLQLALLSENYEKAATLRDKLAHIK